MTGSGRRQRTTAVTLALTGLAIVLASGQGWCQAPAGAPSPWSVGVRPQLINLEGRPGSTRTFDLFVRNFDRYRPAKVYVWLNDPVQRPNGSLGFEPVGSYQYSASRWIQLDRTELLVPPASEERVQATVTIPGGGVAGSFHSLISFSGTPPPDVPIAPQRENEPFVVTRIAFGIIVHLNITDTLQPNAQVQTMFISTDPPPRSGLTRETSKIKRWLVVRVANTGNAMIYGYGWALLRNKDTGLVQRWRIGRAGIGERSVIYPGRYLDMYLPIDRQISPGEYIAQARLEYAPNRAAMGEAVINVTEEQARDLISTQPGAFHSLTVGLSVLVDREFEAIEVAPGGFRTGVLTISNNEDSDLMVELSTTDAVMDADGVVTPGVRTGELSVSEWLRVGPQTFTLPPGVGRRIQYTVGPPQNEEVRKDLVGLILVRARRLHVLEREVENEVIGETGTLLIASMAGRGKLAAELGTLKVDLRPELADKVRFGVPVKNVGDRHFFPIVHLSVQGQPPLEVAMEATAGTGSSRSLVLPGMERIMWMEADRKLLRGGTYLCNVTLDYGGTAPLTRGFTVALQDLEDLAMPQPGADQPAQEPPPPDVEEGKREIEVQLLRVDVAPEHGDSILIGVPVQNTGTVHLYPAVHFTLTRAGDENFGLTATAPAAGDKVRVLPGAEHIFWLRVKRSLMTKGTYYVDVVVDYGAPEPIRRRYQFQIENLSPPTPGGLPGPGGAGNGQGTRFIPASRLTLGPGVEIALRRA